MNRTATAFVTAVLLVVASVAVPATAMAQSTETATETPDADGNDADEESGESETNESETNASAGELLQGAIGVQEAEIDGEIRSRSFGIRVAQAASDEAKADVVAGELDDAEQRLDELEERKQRLRERREAGNISRGTYRAEMAKLAAETETVKSIANDSATVSESLPEDVRERKGIDATAIRTLSERADELSGPEVSRIARSIAGPSAGTELDETPDRGDVANETGTDAERPVNGTATAGDGDADRTATDGTENGTQTATPTSSPDGTENGTQTATPTSSPDGTETESASETDDADGDARSAE